jgi:import inner membrane translocase subunit TIM54
MPRKVTVLLAAPPGDGLLPAREHFHEYVKPILMASGMDWDAIEGRKEGDVRAMVAEKVREMRLRGGEQGGESVEEEESKLIRESRKRGGILDEDAVQGDIVIGRHVWKEYVRGLHEGWLGPLTRPAHLVDEETTEPETSTPEKIEEPKPEPLPVTNNESSTEPSPVSSLDDLLSHTSETEPTKQPSTPETPESEKKPEEKKDTTQKRKQPPPFVSPAEYSSSTIASSCPNKLGPSVTVPMPHLLGFFKTPIRMWWFLNQRKVADDVGRAVAAAVLANYTGYHMVERSAELDDSSPAINGGESSGGSSTRMGWEQEGLLKQEEQQWHKSARKRPEAEMNNGKEKVWIEPMVMDERIASRMCKFEVSLPESSGEFTGETHK